MPDHKAYIESLELSYPQYAYSILRSRMRGTEPAADLTKSDVDQSFIADKSIVSFVSGVPADTRADILNSVILAQLAANKRVPAQADILAWYEAFIDVLKNSGGWAVQASKITDFDSQSSLFEIQSAIVNVLISAFGQNYIGIIKNTLEAISKLADSDGRITAFDKNTRTGSHGCFQMGMAVETNGAVALQMGTFLITTSDTTKRILFIKTSKDATRLQYFSNTATFSPTLYATLRNAIIAKLSYRASQYLDELEI